MRRLVALLALSAGCAWGAEQWTRLTTPHFELYTTANEKRGREIILYFEQVRSFFAQVSPVKGVTEFPVRILVFSSEKQFRPYAPSEAAAAFYSPGRYRDYIVMGDAAPEHLPAAIHEYMHLVVKHSGLKLPVWLNEGWADVYSTLKPMGKKAMIGDLIPGRVQALQSEKWLTFDELTSVGLKSQTYNEKNRAGIFYSESWAFVHMLYLTPEYSPNFPKFVLAMHRGKSAAEACELAFGRSSGQVYADLQAYLRRNRLFGAIYDVKLTPSEEEAQVSKPAPFESGMVQADLLSIVDKRDQAAAAYRKLEAESPGRPEIAQAMGYLAWQNNDHDGARQQLRKAFDAGGRDPQMCFDLGMLELEADQGSRKAFEALRRALEVKPDYTDARLRLGFLQLNAQQFSEALATLSAIHKIDDENAPSLFNALAYANLQAGFRDEARKQAETALKWDKTDAEKRRTEQLLNILNEPAPAAESSAAPPPAEAPTEEKTERVAGEAKAFDCEHKTFLVEVDGKVLSFDMPDPAKIMIRHNGSVSFEFTCGPQKPFHVVVEFAPADRSLRSLEF